MQEIDVILDEHTDMAQEFVDNDIQNQLAHKELQAFNDTGQFIYVHPIAIQNRYERSQSNILEKLQKDNPEELLNEITNTVQNIRRIESDIKKKKYKDDKQYQSWCENLEKAKIKRDLLSRAINR